MNKRAIDLSDQDLTAIFGAATRNAALEAAQCGLSVSGSVTDHDSDGHLRITPAVRLPSGMIERELKPSASGRKRARAA